MQSSLWKLAVIAGVVGLCSLVFYHARRDLAGNGTKDDVAARNVTAHSDDNSADSSGVDGDASQTEHVPAHVAKADDAVAGEAHGTENGSETVAHSVGDPFEEFGDDQHVAGDTRKDLEDLPDDSGISAVAATHRDADNTGDEMSPPLLSELSDPSAPELETIPAENNTLQPLEENAPEEAVGLFESAANEEEKQNSEATDSDPGEYEGGYEDKAEPAVSDSNAGEASILELREPALGDSDSGPKLLELTEDVAEQPDGSDPFETDAPLLSPDDSDSVDPFVELPVADESSLPEMQADSEPVDELELGRDEGPAPEEPAELETFPAADLTPAAADGALGRAESTSESTSGATSESTSEAASGPAADLKLPEANEPLEEGVPPLQEEALPETELNDAPADEPLLIVVPKRDHPDSIDPLKEKAKLSPPPFAENPSSEEAVEAEESVEAPGAADEAPQTDAPATSEARPESDIPAKTTAPVEREEAVKGAPRETRNPWLTIEKLSPPNAVLGKPFIYSIIIRNRGKSSAGRVVVEDEIPRGAKLTGTIPQAELVGKRLIWKLGTLDPGQQRKISIRVIPIAEGPISSVATVNFVAGVAVPVAVKKPELKVEISAPKQARLGQPVVFQFRITNASGVNAKKVVLRDILPTNLTHPGGNDLEYEIGDLPAGQSRSVQLTLTASEQGRAVNHAVISAGGGVSAVADVTLQITSPGVSITRSGPKNHLLKRAASFTNSIKNKAKTPVSDVVVVEKIPAGMKFLKASPGGDFDPKKNTVTWRIQQIAGEETENVSLMLLPESPGAKESIIQVFGDEGQIGKTSATTMVRGFSMLTVEVAEAEQPLQVGERFSYRVRIRNQGNESATGVLTSILLPKKMKLIQAKGPVAYQQTGRQLDFTAIEKVAPKQQIIVDLLLEARQTGDARLQVQIQSDQMKRPFNREISTLIFSDQE